MRSSVESDRPRRPAGCHRTSAGGTVERERREPRTGHRRETPCARVLGPGEAVASRAALARAVSVEPALLWQLIGLGLIAFLVRLIPVLFTGGLHGMVDYDDGVYMGSALSLVHGRIVYRDFLMLNPPGIVYGLMPFAALSSIMSDCNAFAAARVGMMVAGRPEIPSSSVLSGPARGDATALAARRCTRSGSCRWIERSTRLIAPQTATPARAPDPDPSPLYRAAGHDRLAHGAVAGPLSVSSGTIQIWGIVSQSWC